MKKAEEKRKPKGAQDDVAFLRGRQRSIEKHTQGKRTDVGKGVGAIKGTAEAERKRKERR